jgi:hypothetical protein
MAAKTREGRSLFSRRCELTDSFGGAKSSDPQLPADVREPDDTIRPELEDQMEESERARERSREVRTTFLPTALTESAASDVHDGDRAFRSPASRAVGSLFDVRRQKGLKMYRHKAMLDYLASAGFMKTYEQLKEEAPDMVRIQLRVRRALTS